MEYITIQQASIIIAIISGLVVVIGFGYLLFGWLGSASGSYKRSLSMDKLYDEAGGNDPLSDARMTTQIDISTEDHSCAFIMTHKGVKGRQIECKSGCTEEAEDDNSNFCKQFIYNDPMYPKGDGSDDKTESLSDNLLDKTYTRRRNARNSDDRNSDDSYDDDTSN